MEDTLWDLKHYGYKNNKQSLNPYSIGRYSLSPEEIDEDAKYICVLILILLEDTLWGNYCNGESSPWCVLILILLEDTLWG